MQKILSIVLLALLAYLKIHREYYAMLFFVKLHVLDAIRSATASAWARSSLPFKKARCVNSPGFASLAPRSYTCINYLLQNKWRTMTADFNHIFTGI